MRKRFFQMVLAVGVLVTPMAAQPARASQELADAEGLDCPVCHEKGEHERLTDRGMYYELLGNLDGFDEVTEQFGACTYCHVARPGSGELSREGYRFRWMMEDMAGLRAWLAENHPQRARTPPDDQQPREDEPEKDPEGAESPSG